ncbi:MAG: PAS domain-containing protein, partial [Gemmatimonadaceae bacterium]|nr:PAS domain-containing protein [Gemmatimonadaceae bacterium]
MTDPLDTIRTLQDALRLSEERTELALDAANAGVFDADITKGVVYGSARYRELLGVPDGPIDARTTVDIAHPDDRALALAPWRAGEVNGRVCYLIRAKPPGASDWRTFETRARLFRDDAGRVIRIIGVSYDVTDSVARLQAVRASEQRLSAAQAIAGIGTWSYEIPTGEIIWTPELFRMYDIEERGRTGPT